MVTPSNAIERLLNDAAALWEPFGPALPYLLWVAGVLLVWGLLSVAAALVKRRLRAPGYVRQPSLFSRAELDFLGALERALPVGTALYAKVRMADVITPAGASRRREWWQAFTKVSSKHLDFVVVRAQDGVIVAGIELDDRSHQTADRRARDAFVDRAMSQAGVVLIRVAAQRHYSHATLRERLEQAMPSP
jgi:hypothetical protein